MYYGLLSAINVDTWHLLDETKPNLIMKHVTAIHNSDKNLNAVNVITLRLEIGL